MNAPGSQTLVACVGDSITRGQVSSNYVALLDRRFGASGFEFVNFGVNGDLAYNVAQRLDAVIARRPDVVTLLVGGNDVNSRFDERWQQRYMKDQKLPSIPDLDFYVQNVDSILTRLRTETTARVAVLEISMLGENLSSRMNLLVAEYNAALRQLATKHDVTCLALNERLRSSLPPDHQSPPYAGKVSAVMKAALRHTVLRQGWNRVSQRNGLALLTDHIHLNDTAAAVVADLIGGFCVQENNTQPSNPLGGSQ